MYTIWELINNAAQSTVQGFIGVSGMFLFLGAIIAVSAYRVKQFLDEEHKH